MKFGQSTHSQAFLPVERYFFSFSSTVVTVECEMKIFGKIKSFPIFMKIGRSERSHIEMIILEYQHHQMIDKGIISDTIYMFMKIISLEPYVDQSFFFLTLHRP